MTVNSYLTNLASNLVLSSDEKSSIKTSIATLKSRLNSHFGNSITNHYQFGSNTRGTILPRKADSNSDVDYLIIFDTSNGQKKPQTYLNRLKRFAEKKYQTSEIFQSSPTMVLSLNHIKFELVPAIRDIFSIQIPSPSSSWTEWIATNPTVANKKLQEKNKNENYQIKPLVRLIKYWNAEHGHSFQSYLLEKNIIDMSFWFCSNQANYFYTFWNNFYCDLFTPQYIKDRVNRAKLYVKNAKEYENNNKPNSAVAQIKKVVPAL